MGFIVDGEIRLIGPNVCSGRVEVLHNGVWGTVCDDSWDLNDAAVACRQKGCGSALSALPLAYFGAGTGQIWLDDVLCKGNESDLSQCTHNGYGINNCGHGEDAGVICAADGEIRLIGPDLCSGRVEVLHNGVWGTVCDNGWDINDAAVVCRQMGCGSALSAPPLAYFGAGTGQIWLSYLLCTGSESDLSQCTYDGYGINNCIHSEDAGVICAEPIFPTFKKVVKMTLQIPPSLDLNDPAEQEDLLQQLSQKLKDQGVDGEVKLSWRKLPD
ncbi:CD5 antigen-like [Oryzias latipes]|uniref:CD5 antigen-like n=1 Tax=Oryzias latipes TaxID=8090 RepID=UPI000CE17F90|nr:CD5 antigen-like [Oryzias latipes]